jgi:putative ABC transport system permease protein
VAELLTPAYQGAFITMRASGPGDPYLDGHPPPGPREVIISRRTAAEFDTAPAIGDAMILVLKNPLTQEEFDVDVTLAGVSGQLAARFALVHPEIAFAGEAVASAEAVPALGIPGRPPRAGPRDVGRIRLFAADLASAGPLAAEMQRLGYNVEGEWRRIEGVLRLQSNLQFLLVVIAGLSGAGFAISFALSIWVNVERKRKSLAMLRLMGAPSRHMILFPIVQALSVAAIGVTLAFAFFLSVRVWLNAGFAQSLPEGATVAALPDGDTGLLVLITFAVATLAGALGGVAVNRLEPREALRDA